MVSTKVLGQSFEKLVETWSKFGQNLVKPWSGLVKPWSQGAGPFWRMVAEAFSWNGQACKETRQHQTQKSMAELEPNMFRV